MRSADPEPAPETPAQQVPPAAEQSAPEPKPAETAPAATPSGDAVTVETLRGGWAGMLDNLPTKARARFLAGQVVAVNGNVIDYVLPSDTQAQRCEPVRAEVEGAIAQTFGAPLTISLRAGDVSPEAPTAAATAAPEAQHESEIDIHDLTDADGMSSTVVDRIADVFPGAEILDQES